MQNEMRRQLKFYISKNRKSSNLKLVENKKLETFSSIRITVVDNVPSPNGDELTVDVSCCTQSSPQSHPECDLSNSTA